MRARTITALVGLTLGVFLAGLGQGAAERVYTYGARYEPPAGRVLHGMGQWEPYNDKLVAALPGSLRPASVLIFITIADTLRGWQPRGIAATLERYGEMGIIPHIDISLRGLEQGTEGIDREVAEANRYDGRIQDLAALIKNYGRPVMVRIGGEFNGSWNGFHPYAYPKAFRKIVAMFRRAGVENAAFIWCYEPAAPDDFDERNADGEYKWYPGADAIDWYGIDLFNINDFSGELSNRGGLTPYGRTLRFLDMALADGKPVMIGESSPMQYDLSDPARAEAAWTEWFAPYFRLIEKRKEIKWFHLISYDWTKAANYREMGWLNADFTAAPSLLQRLRDELAKPCYLHADGANLLRGY